MSRHDFRFLSRPSVTGQGRFLDVYSKEPLIRGDALAIRQLEHKFPSPDLRTDGLNPDARLFVQLTDSGLLECLTVFDGSARRSPVILTRKRAVLVNETKQEDPSGGVDYQQSGGWSSAHRVRPYIAGGSALVPTPSTSFFAAAMSIWVPAGWQTIRVTRSESVEPERAYWPTTQGRSTVCGR